MTKKEITDKARAILHGDDDLSGDDQEFLLWLFSHHKDWKTRAGDQFLSFSRGDGLFGSRCFVVNTTHGEEVMSYKEALAGIKGKPTSSLDKALKDHRWDTLQAARFAVLDQIREFRSKQDNPSGEVDHVYPMTFSALFYQFCVETNLDPHQPLTTDRNGMRWFTDPVMEEEWQEFHRARAVLRIISKEENQAAPVVRPDWTLLIRRP